MKDNKVKEDWIQKKWRPMMAVMYMTVCAFDFILFPIMFTIVQFWETSIANDAFRQCQPITLNSGGLFHVAMGAVLGVTAWSRGQEKLAGATVMNTQEYIDKQPVAINMIASNPIRRPDIRVGYGGKYAPLDPHQPLL